jgi:prepilin-type N-terminal cleavage/methylation domain-containing protein
LTQRVLRRGGIILFWNKNLPGQRWHACCDVRREGRSAMNIKGNNSSEKSGYTLIEVILVVTIIGLLATIAITNFVIARDNGRITVISTNLREIESAKEQWAIENKKNNGDLVDSIDDLKPYLRGELSTVVNEIYEANAIGTPATASVPVKVGAYAAGSQIVAP